MKPKFLAFPLALVVTSPAIAGDYIWRGTANTTWTDPANWDVTTTPPTAPADTHAIPGKDYPTDRLNIGNGVNSGAVYDPGAGVTTTFRSGRSLLIGSGAGNTANLTVTSGTIAVINAGGAGQEPLMANGASANLLINGGAIDLTGTTLKFILVNSGASAGQTSVLTMTSGSFSCANFDFFAGGSLGTSTVNLDGGVLSFNRLLKTQGSTTSALNLDGGTLRLRSTQTTSPNFTINDLTGLTTTVEDGGVIVDTNAFNGNIAEVLEHDATLGVTADGGLTKNGAGTLTLSGTNTFTGPVTVNAGTALATPSRILLSNDSGAGTGAITLAGDFAEIQVNTTRNIANAVTVSDTSAEKTILLPAAGFAAATFSGPITLNETNIDHFRVRADDNCFLTFSGIVSGPGGIFKYQPGRLDLTNGSNNFAGDVKITHGAVSFTNGALGTTGLIRMEGGATVNGVTLRWDPTNDQDISSRLRMYDGKTATLVMADGGTPYDVSNVTFANAIGNTTTASLVKSGNGTLTLTQPSTYSGGTTLTQGVLEFANGGLGTTGSVTMDGAILRWSTGNTEDISSRIVMVNAKTASFSTNGNDVTFATPIGNSSTGNFAKTTTSGTLTLNGTNTYTGTTTVGGGTLRVNGSLDAASAVTVTGGNLGGTGTIGGSVTIAAGGGLAPGASAGTLSINGNLDIVAMAGGAGKLSFELDALAGTNDSIICGPLAIGAGDLDIDDLDITNLGGLEAGTYTLITSTGLTGTVNGASGPIATGFDGQLLTSGNNLQLVVTAASSGYAAWQAANGNTPGGLGDDHDGDGVDNGTEYFLFGNTSSTGFTALPGVTGNSVTWTKAANGYAGTYGSGFVVETSDTLTSWTTAATNLSPAIADTVYINGDDVTYTFPAGTKKFARLKVTGP